MPEQKKSKFWQTQKFRELQKKWDQKLKATGFTDAESNGKLSQNAFNCYRTQNHTIIEAKQRYYELLGQGHHEEIFKDPVEEYAMRRRSEGISIKQIGEELKALGKKNSRETLRKIVRHFEQKWRIKNKT